MTAEHYYQFVTMHGMIMVVYFLTALFLGGFGELFNSINGWSKRYGFSIC